MNGLYVSSARSSRLTTVSLEVIWFMNLVESHSDKT